jgi:hypothetical protein
VSAPVRSFSESPVAYDRRLCMHVSDIAKGTERVSRDASVVYAEGIVNGLSLAIAILQRRERITDYLKRWENQLRLRMEREHGG